MAERIPAPVALALGSNVGDRMASLRATIKELAPYVEITGKSKVYETEVAYVTAQPLYLNAAVVGTTKLEPLALLWTLRDIENKIGRTPTFHYGPRVIDIDMVFYGDVIMDTPELILPHKRVAERGFVLRPLADIAPEWKHPKNGKTVAEMLAAISDGVLSTLDEAL